MAEQAVPIDQGFTIPADLVQAVEAIRKEYSSIFTQMADELQMIGLPADQAAGVVVHSLMNDACRMALVIAVVLHKREPERDRWLARSAETFDAEIGFADFLKEHLRKAEAERE